MMNKKCLQIREYLKPYGFKFSQDNYDMLEVFQKIFKGGKEGSMEYVEYNDGRYRIKHTQSFLTKYFPRLRDIRKADYLHLRKYRDKGFLELDKDDEGTNHFRPTDLFLKFFSIE